MVFQKIPSIFEKLKKRRFRPSIRAKQLLILGGTSSVIIMVGILYLSLSSSEANSPTLSPKKSDPKPVSQLTTPLKVVDERDVWVSRVEKKAEEVKEESQNLRQENRFLQKRLDVLEEMFKNQSTLAGPQTKEAPLSPPPSVSPSGAPTFPATGHQIQEESETTSFASPPLKAKKRGPRIAHISGRASGVSFKTKDLYMPAGTYSKAVLVSGLAASTATNAQGNPQPMMLRLVDDGNLPRGFKGRVKDAVVIGSCYGDISSERAYCRLETLSWVEADGTTVEKKVEGWVFGEDGRAGMKGEVVDRSSDIARESFGAGLLSAAANFFKMESGRGVYPVSPFGQANAMSNKEAMQGAAASGVGNALDRLAEFSIKRAEQMQPVILIASGRVVDIAFKEGVSLLAEEEAEMKRIGQRQENAQEEGDPS